jgi:hypothetical protein
MYNNINKLHKEAHGVLENAAGGAVRGARGRLVEDIIKILWESLGGTVSKQKVLCTRNTEECRIGLDAVLYKDGEMKGLVECKSYLDLSFLKRAEWDSKELTENGYIIPKIILALENSVKDATKDYVLEGNYVNKIFYLCQGKRSSNKPIYKKEFYKDIDSELFNTLYTYLKKLIRE